MTNHGIEDTLVSEEDLYLFNEGSHFRLYEKLGSHVLPDDRGTAFAVWAPNAKSVSLIGDFNDWNKTSHPLSQRGDSGIWEAIFPEAQKGTRYKYHIRSRHDDYAVDKADPFGFFHEEPPRTGSVVWELGYEWNDGDWMASRAKANALDAPMSIYEVHLGSWQRVPEEDGRSLSYRELAPRLASYVREMGFTHVEILPVMEHPFYGSWGYQTTGYFAPTARYGAPEDFMHLVDVLHRNGIGVILDWVPSHFPSDEHGLAFFDGTHLYEHADPRKGYHPDWNSYIFNYGRHEVRSFLLSSATFWLEKYHVDGLRVDAIASMLYLDYSRKEGEWIPNEHGGRENLEAIEFLRRFNQDVYGAHDGVQTIAEDSTAWPMVSRPTYVGGLGFGMKWDMGFMHDTLKYFSEDPIHRKYHHDKLTFRMLYAFNENFVLPFSHDEVVHGKGSMLGKMPGDDWRKFANLRLLYGYMYAQPGKKLLFMGAELGQWAEWNHETSLDWHLLEEPSHRSLKRWLEDLNRFYRGEPALFERDTDPGGFQWIDCTDSENSVVALVRRGKRAKAPVLAVFNGTPVPRQNYRLGAPKSGTWLEALNSDAPVYGGSGQGNLGSVETSPVSAHGYPQSINLVLPPLSAMFFTWEDQER